MMNKPIHICKYMRVLLGGRKIVKINGRRHIIKTAGTEVYKCALPGCTTFRVRELAVGQKSICWKCGEELILNMENTTLKKPTHRECRKSRYTDHEAA